MSAAYHNHAGTQGQTSSRGFGQTIVRVVRREQPFVTVERATAQDSRLSWAARGLLVYLLSLPADWQIKVEHLQRQGGRGRDALRGLLRELQALGYVSGYGRQERGPDGRLRPCELRAYESPDLNPHFEGEPPPTDSPAATSPAPDSPATENPAPENTPPYRRKSVQRKDSTKDTPTPRARASRAAPPPPVHQVNTPPAAAGAGVGVGSSKSRFSFAERQAHADAHGLKWGWLTLSQDGRYDEVIDAAGAAAQPAAVERSLVERPRPGMGLRAALLHVGSLLDLDPDADVAAEAALLDLSDEDRQHVLAYDFSARRAAAQARLRRPRAASQPAAAAPAGAPHPSRPAAAGAGD